MSEQQAIEEVLASVQPMPQPSSAVRAAVADELHVRDLRRACGCPLCRAELEGANDA